MVDLQHNHFVWYVIYIYVQWSKFTFPDIKNVIKTLIFSLNAQNVLHQQRSEMGERSQVVGSGWQAFSYTYCELLHWEQFPYKHQVFPRQSCDLICGRQGENTSRHRPRNKTSSLLIHSHYPGREGNNARTLCSPEYVLETQSDPLIPHFLFPLSFALPFCQVKLNRQTVTNTHTVQTSPHCDRFHHTGWERLLVTKDVIIDCKLRNSVKISPFYSHVSVC